MLPTLVECDARGRALSPAITWQDARAEPEAAALCAAVGADTLYRVTGQRVDGRYLAPMHARMTRLGLGGSTVCSAKDLLFAHLTGELLTDPSTAAGTGVYDLDGARWDPELVEAARLPGLPTLAPASTIRPLHVARSAELGLPAGFRVVLGAADSVLGALGVGATRHGDVAVIVGTSAIVLGISDAPVRDGRCRYLVTPLAGVGWGLEMDLLAVGSAFDGIAGLLGLPNPAALLESAATIPPGEAPMFLPYLAPGEQGALWDPELTGTLHGLRLGMRAAHVGRGLLTGVVIELRRCTEILASVTGRRGPVLLGGGGAQSPLLWQDLADATGREVLVDRHARDHSAIGAATFAANALGQPVPYAGDVVEVEPRAELHGWWSDAAEGHDALRLSIGRS